ncbi:MAG: ATP-dependent Clp protease proteolytic subunit [Deltaproteobacteria bacterium]|nr:ATP-dependent Clp protease proteolytic subunit [Deltaproteobacteria bacterium]
MPQKKGPIITVLVVLGIVVVFLGMVLVVFFSISRTGPRISFQDQIGVIPIEGTITSSRQVVSQLVRFRKDRRIKAIILRVNSPGGGVAPSQEIDREVRKTIATKRVIASMGSLAASGGTTLPLPRIRLWPTLEPSPAVSVLSWNLFSSRSY